MRVAILTSTLSRYSGIDRVVIDQAQSFISNNHQVTVFALSSDVEIPGVKVIVLGMPESLFLQRMYRLIFFLGIEKIKKYSKNLKEFDIIYSHQYPMNLIAQATKKKYGVRYVYYNHGVAPPVTFSNMLDKLYIKIFSYLSNNSIRNADWAVSVSKYLANILKEETGVSSEIQLNSIDTKRFNSSLDGSKVRQKHGLNKDPVILYVGRISPHKGIHLLIKSFNNLLKTIPSAKLLIVGQQTFGQYMNKLKALATDQTIFTGFVEDHELPHYYAACDVYATASLWEGYDLPISEAQACGKPVVAFDICSHPEIIDDKGILVKINDLEEFSDGLKKILSA